MGSSDSTLSGVQGFQVSRVLPNSPAHLCGLVPFFDIIIAVDRVALLDEVPEFFKHYVKQKKGEQILLTVYNLRIRATREIPFVPTDEWGGQGLLGCSIDWASADQCLENTWHVVDIFPGSAAAGSELVPQRDYIIGMQPPDEQIVTMFRRPGDFHSRLDTWRALRSTNSSDVPSSLLLLIFDSIDNSVKEVLVEMGDCTALGVDVANGYLHVVPATPGTTRLPVIKKFFVRSSTGEAGATHHVHHHHHHHHETPDGSSAPAASEVSNHASASDAPQHPQPAAAQAAIPLPPSAIPPLPQPLPPAPSAHQTAPVAAAISANNSSAPSPLPQSLPQRVQPPGPIGAFPVFPPMPKPQ